MGFCGIVSDKEFVFGASLRETYCVRDSPRYCAMVHTQENDRLNELKTTVKTAQKRPRKMPQSPHYAGSGFVSNLTFDSAWVTHH